MPDGAAAHCPHYPSGSPSEAGKGLRGHLDPDERRERRPVTGVRHTSAGSDLGGCGGGHTRSPRNGRECEGGQSRKHLKL